MFPIPNHPRAIHTTLRDGRLTGEKTFVTLGPHAEVLVVLANIGTDDLGRNRLVACAVDVPGEGVCVTPGPALPMVPEIPHGRLILEGAPPSVVWPGDGYAGVSKPFRTLEDIHVHAALGAWLVGVALEARWPDPEVEALLASLAALDRVAALDPTAAGTHRALGGVLAMFAAQLERIEPLWTTASESVQQMWARDRVLLRIAGKARRSRLERARLVR
jgi:hypothetical protein